MISSRSWAVLKRQEVWSDERKDDSLQMPITFQPEDTGYCVASITVVASNQSQISQESGGCELSFGKEEHSSLPPKELPPIPLPTTVMRFSASEIEAATNNFDVGHLVGEGGFGRVYRAMLRHTPAAIKILNKEGEQALHNTASTFDPELKSEVIILSKFRHPNLVPLMGFCKELSVLVYEYMNGGSLYHRLHDDSDRGKLFWDERAMVLKDVCLGMVYLHSAKPPLIHQDIKSNGRGRIGDFGFSWELPDVEGSRSVFTSRGFAFSKGYTAHDSPMEDVARSRMSTAMGFNVKSEHEVLDYLKNGTLVGFLPVPHPIFSSASTRPVRTQSSGSTHTFGEWFMSGIMIPLSGTIPP